MKIKKEKKKHVIRRIETGRLLGKIMCCNMTSGLVHDKGNETNCPLKRMFVSKVEFYEKKVDLLTKPNSCVN